MFLYYEMLLKYEDLFGSGIGMCDGAITTVVIPSRLQMFITNFLRKGIFYTLAEYRINHVHENKFEYVGCNSDKNHGKKNSMI
jgi:hypothetical protein